MSKLLKKLSDESGSHMLISLALMLGILWGIPILFMLTLALNTTRRTQIAADAAALASAQEIANTLSIRLIGRCGEPHAKLVRTYRAWLDNQVQSKTGQAMAVQYAQYNRATLSAYSVVSGRDKQRHKIVTGQPFPSFNSVVMTDANVPLIGERFVESWVVQSDASSTIYFDQIVTDAADCLDDGKPAQAYTYRVNWKYKLID